MKPQRRQLGFWETVRQNTHLKQYGTSQIAMVASIKGPISVSIVKKSLRILFDKQPLLRARIETVDDRYSFVMDRHFHDIPFVVIERTSPLIWETVVEHELAHPVPTHNYLWKVVLIHGKEQRNGRHELLIFFHHCMADGLSGAHAIQDVLRNCALLADGKEPLETKFPLFDCLEKMLKKPLNWEEYIQQLENFHPLHQDDNWHYSSYQPVGHRVTSGLFKELPYASLLQRCKQESVTINSAIAAALIYSGQEQQIHKGVISLLTLVDLRAHCEPVVPRDYIGCYVTAILTKHKLTGIASNNFWQCARDYQKELYETIPKIAYTPYEFSPQQAEQFSIANPLGLLNGQQPPTAKDTYAVDFCLTNLGLIDIEQSYGSFQLKQFYFCTSRQAGSIGCIANVVSFPQKMHFCFGYATPLLDKIKIQKITAVFFKILGLETD